MMNNKIRRRSNNLDIVFASMLFLAFWAGCPLGDGGNPIVPTPPPITGSFTLTVSGLQGVPAVSIVNPPPLGDPQYPHNGVTLDFINYNADIQVGAISVAGSNLSIDVTVTNNTGKDLDRVWLTVRFPTNGAQVDAASIDGYLAVGYYYYLGSLLNGQQAVQTVSFKLPSGAVDGFDALLDVASVYDRVVFLSSYLGTAPEVYSINPDGSDLWRLTALNGADYPTNAQWSPDGGWVALGAGPGFQEQIVLARADGLGSDQLTCLDGYQRPGGFTRDGKGIYIRRKDPALNEANIYLLDIAAARADCSGAASTILTPLTVAYPGSENLPVVSPDYDMLMYSRFEDVFVAPPYDPAETLPGPDNDPGNASLGTATPCPDWVFGSEYTWQAYNLYLLPLDPATGLSTGPPVKYWDNVLFDKGEGVFAPDQSSIVAYAGGGYPDGCGQWQSYCPAGSNQWGLPQCNIWVNDTGTTSGEGGVYQLPLPSSLSDPLLPYDYMKMNGSFTRIAGTGKDDFDPSWSADYDLILFDNISAGAHQLWYFDPIDPANTRAPVALFPNNNYMGRFMPSPGTP